MHPDSAANVRKLLRHAEGQAATKPDWYQIGTLSKCLVSEPDQ